LLGEEKTMNTIVILDWFSKSEYKSNNSDTKCYTNSFS